MSAQAGGNNLANNSGYWTGGAPLKGGGFNQAQQNYINAEGKLPTAFGGDALSQAQQNFFQGQGYLPKGFESDLGQGYYRQQPQQRMLPAQWAGGNKGGGGGYY
jgi:hypothetical protein